MEVRRVERVREGPVLARSSHMSSLLSVVGLGEVF